MPKGRLTAKQIRQLFDYKNGNLYWKHQPRPNNPIDISVPAGTIHHTGYIYINTRGHSYAAHRLIWIYFTGKWPPHQIDHKDKNKLNNAIDNLRCASHSNNQMNQSKRRDNTSGYKGVSWHKDTKKWRARIRVNTQRIELGSYDTKEEAYEAYCKAAIQYHGDFASV